MNSKVRPSPPPASPASAPPIRLEPCPHCGAALKPANLERHFRTKCPKSPERLRAEVRRKTAFEERKARNKKVTIGTKKKSKRVPGTGTVARPFQGGLCSGG